MTDDDGLDFEDFGGSSDNWGIEPQKMDADTFRQRNDPQQLLMRFRLQLMNAYEKDIVYTDDEGNEKTKKVIRYKKGTDPKANSQGIEDIISYVEKFINNHVVQGNIPTVEDFRENINFISNDVTAHFMGQRKKWGVKLEDIDSIISMTINLIYFYLTRLLFNEERKSYGEVYKESTSREIKERPKNSLMQRLGSFLAGGNG